MSARIRAIFASDFLLQIHLEVVFWMWKRGHHLMVDYFRLLVALANSRTVGELQPSEFNIACFFDPYCLTVEDYRHEIWLTAESD